MGCVSSKQAVSVTPAYDHSGVIRENGSSLGNSGRSRGDGGGGEVVVVVEEKNVKDNKTTTMTTKEKKKSVMAAIELGTGFGTELDESGLASSNGMGESLSFRLGSLQRYVEGAHVAAGWPAWLSAVAGEAIHGWVPLQSDSYEKLEKIGQGTYSSVFRALDLETGKIVALKKVRLDNFEPESVRFMAREITILRKLDHQNVIKLEGLITSRLSCSLYLVFEYMDHDIAGLLSCPKIKFTESQIKCYMKQLLSGLEHCHSRGVMHRDIKGSNLLVNNEGILKLGDFGLANFSHLGQKQPLTSRVVTLWYRPPELLLGSTEYGAAVDLWSVGCVFAELLVGRPILQGRTEVEQLHKIFKLCGSPPDEYWKKTQLPHATLFRPQHPYETCLRDTFRGFPPATVDLLETLLSIEPYNRGTASSALASEYFSSKPNACDPSSIPIYPPSKEIDARNREEARRSRTKISGRVCRPEKRKATRKSLESNKLAPSEEFSVPTQDSEKIKSIKAQILKVKKLSKGGEASSKLSTDNLEDAIHVKDASQGDIPFSGPLQVSTSSSFAWAKRRRDSSIRSHSRSISRGLINPIEFSTSLQSRHKVDTKRHENGDICGLRTESRGRESNENVKVGIWNQWSRLGRPDSFDASDGYHSSELSMALYIQEEMEAKRNMGYQDPADRVEFSGPLLSQSHRVDELLDRHERHIRRRVRISRFQKGKKHGK